MNLKPHALALLLACNALAAHAVGTLADVTVVDRDSGATLPVYHHRGDYWVAGRPGARYAVALRNRSGGRILTVTSVDGVNVVSGETAAWDQSGYVLPAGKRYQITGWRKSDDEVAAFEFSDARDSYASRTGRPLDTGVIGVAVFRERVAAVPYQPTTRSRPAPADSDSRKSRSEASAPADAATPPPSPVAPAAQPAPSPAANRSARPETESRESVAPFPQAAPVARLGTAHGQRESSHVSTTAFERQQERPNEVIRIRYDSRENLLASGVIPPPPASPVSPAQAPNAFPGATTSYVPDPPRRPSL